MAKRKIAIFTGNRAEYGLQYSIIKSIKEHSKLDYNLLVSGAHLDKNFGNTLDEIKNDGFEIFEEIKIEMVDQSNISTANAIGKGIILLTKSLEKIKPDFMLVYADRFEGFAATVAASQMNIPTAHIEGGDLTEGGALDDSVRHAMTKLSHLHFTTNYQSTNRILALGEEKWRVHTVGLPIIDLIYEKNYADEKYLVENLNLDLSRPIIILTQHPVTTEYNKARQQIKETLKAIAIIAKMNVQIIITYPNNDVGSLDIIDEINKLKIKKNSYIKIYKSLGRFVYHGILGLVKDSKTKVVCLGNSSSGIKETPVFCCPCVNIGSRQKGRLRSNNVIDVSYNSYEIVKAVKYALEDNAFLLKCKEAKNPYFLGGAGRKIADILANIDIDDKMLKKKMTLKGVEKDGWYR